ncbi:pseudouridine synthase [Tenacibaculum piscium]|uniref:Pseudouridine synthase n=3 Tax=Tenacibaculum piscium TaxID=1458515 RepID=A0A2H1YKG0_9FLAO|nr:pseudouridine synthase [Tenacibaculum piscium]MBE7629319.1 pseudouridine synthase [Tenacibaculum piscium]MBE7670106.1 pseudouridine synthase [Tenacibaculum piscium]MBE7690054.1 pseudouridine synthase [Tenacibaculum piscium]SOS75890.1 Pseudouridine synthase [Tenacibaculum piscium]
MKHRHFIIHKPYGFLSQFITNQTKRKKKMLGELFDFPEKTMAIGRLDVASEGLLFLTTDGKVSAAIRSKKVEKEYYVQVDGIITPEALEKLQKGVEIGVDGQKYTTLPGKAFALKMPNFPNRTQKIRDQRHGPTSWVAIVITEGKFRQVRKMTAAVGFPTLRLIRVRIGNILLNDMKSGAVIETETLL